MLIYRMILAALLSAMVFSGSARATGNGLEELPALPAGHMAGSLSGIEVYNHMRSLCNETGGRPLAVVSKRFGGFVRLVEVSPDEAARHIASSGQGKYPWYLACEGEPRFIVEKDYQYNPGGPDKYRLSLGRGLEWLDYVKADEPEKVARLEALSMSADAGNTGGPDEKLLEEMAVQASAAEMDFVRAGNGARYEADYNGGKKAGGCRLVTIKYTGNGQPAVRSFDYRVCGRDVALINGGGPAAPKGPVALLAGEGGR